SLNVTRALLFSRHVTATAATYTLSLHDALPILRSRRAGHSTPLGAHGQGIDPHRRAALLHAPHAQGVRRADVPAGLRERRGPERSEEHTSELQSRENLVCRLLLEKKKKHIERYT